MHPILTALKDVGVDFVVTLPDSRLHDLIQAVSEDKEIVHVPVAREEEGVGVCAGAYLGGRKPAMIIQNAGLLAAVNGLATLTLLYNIPMLLLVSYRGNFGENSFFHVPLGLYTEPVLNALNIQYQVLNDPTQVLPSLRDAQTLADAGKQPVALLLTKTVLGG